MKTVIKSIMKKAIILIIVLFFLIFFISFLRSFAFIDILKNMLEALIQKNLSSLTEYFVLLLVLLCVFSMVQVLKKAITLHLNCLIESLLINEIIAKYKQTNTSHEIDREVMLSEVNNHIPQFSLKLVSNLESVLGLSFSLLCSIWYGFTLNPIIMSVTIIIVVLFIFINRKNLNRAKRDYENYSASNNRFYSIIWEQIENREIAHYLNLKRLLQPVHDVSDQLIDSLTSVKKSSNSADLLAVGGYVFLFLATVSIGGFLISIEFLNASALVAFILLIPLIANSFFSIPKQVNEINQLLGQYRILESDYHSLMSKTDTENLKGFSIPKIETVEVRGVDFSYTNDLLILQQVTFNLEASSFVCIAGASGCGKSTLGKLIARYLGGYQGRIAINGQEITEWNLASYWKRVKYISYDYEIFNDTIANNIVLGSEFDEKLLTEALRKADLMVTITERQITVQTIINPDQLSSGEKQKVNIARYFYHLPKIIIFDEVTSALDSKSEKIIIENIRQTVIESESICLFITHRLLPLEKADSVIYLEKGSVCDIKAHDELMMLYPSYRDLIGDE